MGWRVRHLILAAFFGAAIALVVFAPRWVEDIGQDFDQPPTAQPALGQIKLIDGKAAHRPFGHTTFEPLAGTQSLHHLQTINIENRGRAEITMAGYTLMLTGPGQFVGEMWSSSNPKGPLVLHWLSGQISLVKEGEVGRLFVTRGSEMTDPKRIVRERSRTLEISQLNVTTPPPAPALTAPASPPEASVETEGTLTNEYMDDRIAQEKDQFQRCQSNALREHGDVKGQILIGLTIHPRGQIDEVRVLNSTLASESLKTCVLEIFRRLHFKPFKGDPIVRSYPLSFE